MHNNPLAADGIKSWGLISVLSAAAEGQRSINITSIFTPTHSIDRPNLTMSGKSPLNKDSIVTLIRSVEERRSRFYFGTSIGITPADRAYNWEEHNDDSFNYELPKLYYDRTK